MNFASRAFVKTGMSVPPSFRDSMVVIEHLGRSSGRRYSTPAGFVREDDNRLLVVAESGVKADWVRNVLAGPVEVWIRGKKTAATARVRSDLDSQDVWRRMESSVVAAFGRWLAKDPVVIEFHLKGSNL